MQNLTGHLHGGSSDICLTITSSRLPLLFFPLVFTRPFDGEGGVDLTGVLMGDGVLGEVCCGSDWVFESEKMDSGGGVGARGGEGEGFGGGHGGEMDEGVGTGGGSGSGGKKTGGVEGDGRGEAKNMDGDKGSSSCFSVSVSSLTSAGGSMPYLEATLASCMRHKHTSLGCF